jgi:hypothetical protein
MTKSEELEAALYAAYDAYENALDDCCAARDAYAAAGAALDNALDDWCAARDAYAAACAALDNALDDWRAALDNARDAYLKELEKQNELAN